MKKTEFSSFGAKDWYEQGQLLAQDGRHGKAIEALGRAIAKNPAYAEAYFVRGACHYALGSYQDAGDDLDAAAILGCRDAQFWSKHSIHSVTKNTDDGQE